MPDMLHRLGPIGAWQHWQKLNLHCDSEAKVFACVLRACVCVYASLIK